MVELEPGTPLMFAMDEGVDIREVVLADPNVQARMEAMGLTNMSLVFPLPGLVGFNNLIELLTSCMSRILCKFSYV